MNFKKLPTLAATPKPPLLVEKPLKTHAASNGNAVFEMDLTQDDFDDILGGLKEKTDATKATASMEKRNNGTNKKKSRKNGRLGNVAPIAPKVPPTPPPPQQQKQTNYSALCKRQRTRSTGVRYKVSEALKKVCSQKFCNNFFLSMCSRRAQFADLQCEVSLMLAITTSPATVEMLCAARFVKRIFYNRVYSQSMCWPNIRKKLDALKL